MRVKKIMVSLLMCGLFLTGCGNEVKEISNNEQSTGSSVSVQNEADVSVLTDAKVQHSLSGGMDANDCSTYKKMEEQSDVIIYGKKVREFFVKTLEESEGFDLMSEVEIEKSIKASGQSYQKGTKIIVREGISYFPNYNMISHQDGYQQMENGENYYLMLGKVYPEKEDDNQYYIIGGTYGKIPENESEKILYESAECKITDEDKDRADKWVRRNRKELLKQ